jgi:SAM-dependent methyltransferase
MTHTDGTDGPTAPTPSIDPDAARRALADLSASFAAGDHVQSEVHARLLLGLVPADPTLRRILAESEQALGKSAQAFANLRRALTANPAYLEALFDLVTLLSRAHGSAAQVIRLAQRCQRLAPDTVGANLNLANILRDAGRIDEAILYYHQALAIGPGNAAALSHAAEALARMGEDVRSCPGEAPRRILIACLESREVESNTLNLASQAFLRRDLAPWLVLEHEPLQPADLQELLKVAGDLAIAHLMDSLITDPLLETLFTEARECLLRARMRGGVIPVGCNGFARALAWQGGLNEYLWAVSPREEAWLDALGVDVVAAIEGGAQVEPADLHLLAAYRTLQHVEPIRRWASARRDAAEAAMAEDLDVLILDRVREERIAGEIPDLTPIDDSVSHAVKAEYEDNPYPRWNALTRYEPIDPLAQIGQEIAPNTPVLDPLPDAPRVLIAGCGTGRQAVQAAMTYAGASILAVDLSRPSLAYARRVSDRLGYGAIRYARADILGLPAIAERFQIIECTGVLHHMADPAAGLKALLSVLATGGVMKIALYSAAARENVTRLRRWIADHNFPPTLEGIRAFRAALSLSGHPDAEATCRSLDYNATSAIRDLLFHAQEHQFTIPALQRLLEDNELEFLGFLFRDATVKSRFVERFPSDPGCIDLANWAAFEADNPLTFVSMYQFWCRRRQ